MRPVTKGFLTYMGAALFLVLAFPAIAADKTTPDDLRNKHAGKVTIASQKTVADLYPVLLAAAERCWAEVRSVPMVGGAIGAATMASRSVQGELSPDLSSGYFAVKVRTALGIKYMNFLQVDLKAAPGGSQIDVFHRNNVKAQRDFVVEVQHWINGETEWCAPSPSKVKPR